MNHRTPAEQFRATLAALSREQLEQAMHYLRGFDPSIVDKALEVVSIPVTAVTVTYDELDAELAHIAIEGTL